jgi:nitrogen fixation NifU-like protein
MYREIILDHYRSPRGKKPIEKVDIHSGGHNPACGDEIEVEIEVRDNVLKDIHVDCKGCAISVASGSMLAESVKGKSFEEVKELAESVRHMLKGEGDDIPEEFEDLDALKGVRQFPVRVKCALLSWLALIEGIENFKKGKTDDKTVVSTEEDS